MGGSNILPELADFGDVFIIVEGGENSEYRQGQVLAGNQVHGLAITPPKIFSKKINWQEALGQDPLLGKTKNWRRDSIVQTGNYQ